MQPEGKAAATYSTATTEKESNLIFPRVFERGRAKMGKERAEFVAGKKKQERDPFNDLRRET